MAMNTLASSDLPATDLRRALFVSLGIWLALLALAGASGRPIGIAAVLMLPVAAWLLVSPRTSFYVYMLSVPIYYPFREAGFALWAFDVVTVILAVGLVLESFLRGADELRRTPFDLPLIGLVLATWVSALFAYSGADAIVPSIRILVIFIAFRAVFVMSLRLGVRRVLLLYVYIVFALSVINVALFTYHGGALRIFGPSGLAFEAYAMTALPMALAFFIWAKSQRERARFGIVAAAIALAIFASGSRGTLLAVALGIPCLLILAWKKTHREQTVMFGGALLPLVVVGGIIAVMVAVSSTTLFGLFLSRVGEAAESVQRPVGTIELRLVLWTAAMKAWLSSPIVGIGVGNFDLVDQIVPEIRMAPVWYYIRGMSAHNVVLHYLAETGLVGVIALLAVPWAGLRTVRHFFRAQLNLADTQVSMALTIAIIVFAMSLFFMRAWTWAQEGHVMAMILGMTAAWHYRQTTAHG